MVTTTLLKSQKDKSNYWKTTLNFLARRLLRKLPIYLLMLSVYWILNRHNFREYSVYFFTFTQNYFIAYNTTQSIAFAQTWSLAIQEQFYIIDAAFHLISPIIQNGILKKNYIESSSIDSVTRVYNRSYLVEHLNKYLSLTINRQSQIYFLMVGIDHFKAVIDEFNHDIADTVLIELTKIIHSNISEFVTAFPNNLNIKEGVPYTMPAGITIITEMIRCKFFKILMRFSVI